MCHSRRAWHSHKTLWLISITTKVTPHHEIMIIMGTGPISSKQLQLSHTNLIPDTGCLSFGQVHEVEMNLYVIFSTLTFNFCKTTKGKRRGLRKTKQSRITLLSIIIIMLLLILCFVFIVCDSQRFKTEIK